jgi:histidinol phosphatase-like enzyme (inositol monophosphatase family)
MAVSSAQQSTLYCNTSRAVQASKSNTNQALEKTSNTLKERGLLVTARGSGSDFHRLLKFAHTLADLSGPAVLKHFRKPVTVDNKDGSGGFDPVTKADRGAERVIVQELKARFPDHGVIGEEYGIHAGKGRYNWVLDPIDGTRSYIIGSAMWGTLIGLLDDGKPLLGMMDQPFTGERFYSEAKAAYVRGRDGRKTKLKTRPCEKLTDAIFTTTHPDLFATLPQQTLLTNLKDKVRMARYGTDCYGYCLLSAGFVDLVIEPDLKIYDIAPLIPIIERSGGVVTTWDGKPATNGGNIIAAGDKRIHEQAMKMIGKSCG